jgi:FkbM family methyltransferase
MPSRSAVYVGNDRVLVRAANRFKYYVDATDIGITPHLITDGVWEESVERVLTAKVGRGMHVFEVGANVGYFTVLLAHLVGESGSVTAFEAEDRLAQFARDNIEINGFHRRARVVEVAVTDRIGEATFYTRDRHRGGGSLIDGLEQVPWNPSDTKRAVTVPTTTLDAYIAANGVQPDVVKIDAEGAESLILRGAEALLASGRALSMNVEFSPDFVRAAGDDPAAFLTRLTDHGFAIARIDERTRKTVATSADWLLAHDFSELWLTRGATRA